MEKIIRKLNESIILSRKDIMRSEWVSKKNIQINQNCTRLKKLFEKVNIIIAEHLHSVSSIQSIAIRRRIIDKCLMSIQTDISKKNILDELIELDTSEEEVKVLLKT